MFVRARFPCVPRYLRWKFDMLSGPLACEFFSLLMIFCMIKGLVRVVVWSSENLCLHLQVRWNSCFGGMWFIFAYSVVL